MFTISLQNSISPKGLELLPKDRYKVSDGAADPDAILVRSANLHEIELPKNLKAIARAGAGVNNIPIDACTERGIVVFNTPGANANAVKELVLAALFLSSRRIHQGIGWAQSLPADDGLAKAIEKGKSQFAGPELSGKCLGVIGLGAIGAKVANAALDLGMDVMGYDPFISVEAAWRLSRDAAKADSLEEIYKNCDYITLHAPLIEETKAMLSAKAFAQMKPGVRIVNLARGALVDNKALLGAIKDGVVASYVTDFPVPELMGNARVITLPHLGASTPEAEENCAVMAARQLKNFLETGSIMNSVNFPNCALAASPGSRLVVAHLNIPNMVGQITTLLAAEKLNITELLNHHRDNLGYTMIDVESGLTPAMAEKVRKVDGVKTARVIGLQPQTA